MQSYVSVTDDSVKSQLEQPKNKKLEIFFFVVVDDYLPSSRCLLFVTSVVLDSSVTL